MKFVVSRASNSWAADKEKSPCPEARRETLVRVDEMSLDDPRKRRFTIGDTAWWYDDGTNHRVEDGIDKRDFHETVWTVEIMDLAELLMFIDGQGKVIVRLRDTDMPTMPHIEIYDGWRE